MLVEKDLLVRARVQDAPRRWVPLGYCLVMFTSIALLRATLILLPARDPESTALNGSVQQIHQAAQSQVGQHADP